MTGLEPLCEISKTPNPGPKPIETLSTQPSHNTQDYIEKKNKNLREGGVSSDSNENDDLLIGERKSLDLLEAFE